MGRMLAKEQKHGRVCEEGGAERLISLESAGRMTLVLEGKGGQKTNDESGTKGAGLGEGLPLSTSVL